MAAPEDSKIEEASTGRSVAKNVGKKVQEEEFNVGDHYDVMIVGMTGQGKSTTADKMVIASGPDKVTNDEDEVKSKNNKSLNVWLLGASPELMDVYTDRLVHSSLSKDPHVDVNNYYEELAEDNTKPVTTFSCHLISNEATKIRVLDVPGFFGDTQSDLSSDKINICTQEHIKAMRNILRIQSAMRMQFRRILYFLPVRGPLTNRNKILMHDIHLLARYFGKSVFESMILVATLPTFLKEQPFPDNLLEKTQVQFQKALMEVLPNDAMASPPAIFISMSDECEEIVEKVKSAKVAKDCLELSIHQGVCLKCFSLINWVDKERVECIAVGTKEAFPFEDTFCHPIFIPQGYTVERIEYEGDVPYVVYCGNKLNEAVEVCQNCGEVPGTKGCMKMGTEFTVNFNDGNHMTIKVDHTNKIENHRLLRQKDVKSDETRELVTPVNVDQNTPVSEERIPQHRIMEESSSTENEDSVSPKSKAVEIPGGGGRRRPQKSRYNSDTNSEDSATGPHQETVLQVSLEESAYQPIAKGSSLVAQTSDEYLSAKLISGNKLSTDMRSGIMSSMLGRQKEQIDSEQSLLEDAGLADVKGT